MNMNAASPVSKEIERRFLVPLAEATQRAISRATRYIEQCYLDDSGSWQIRSRMKLVDGQREYFLTMKKRTGHGECIEIELPGSVDAHAQVIQNCGTVLGKTRTEHPLSNGHVLELDIFRDEDLLPGYAIAEVELATINDDISLPHWIGREITGDHQYSNHHLFQRLLQRAS